MALRRFSSVACKLRPRQDGPLRAEMANYSPFPYFVDLVPTVQNAAEPGKVYRSLCVEEYGSTTGQPVIFFHPTPGSRVSGALFEKAAKAKGIRLISVDRPGIGKSTMVNDRTISDFVSDIQAVCDGMSIRGNISLLAWGAGTPYALACLEALKNRVKSTHLVSPIGPIQDLPSHLFSNLPLKERFINWASKTGPMWFQNHYRMYEKKCLRWSPSVADQLVSVAHPNDVKLVRKQGVIKIIADDLREAFSGAGHNGVGYDHYLTVREWPLSLSSVQSTPASPVVIWHGEKDVDCTPDLAKAISEKIIGSVLRPLPDHGNLSLCSSHVVDTILSTIASSPPSQSSGTR